MLLEVEKKFIDSEVKKHKKIRGGVIIVLQNMQKKFGYVSKESQEYIAKNMGLSAEEVFEVVSFYSYFSTNPKGKYKINICMGTACFVLGSETFLNVLKRKLGINPGEVTQDGLFSLDMVMCLGCCVLGPVMKVNEEVYGKLTEKKIDEVLEKYRKMEGVNWTLFSSAKLEINRKKF